MRQLVTAAVIACVVALGAEWSAAGPEEPPAPAGPTVRGVVVDAETGEPVAGATVVATTERDTAAAITDERGGYELVVPPAARQLDVYYGEAAASAPLALGAVAAAGPVEVPPVRIDTAPLIIACYFGDPRTARTLTAPSLGATLRRAEVALARTFTTLDVATLAPWRAPDGAVTAVRLDGARRLGGAPPLSLAFVADATTRTRWSDDGHVVGARELDVTSAAGGNAAARWLRLGAIRDADATAELATLWRGPLARDRAWYAAGADLRGGRDGVASQLYGRLDAAPRLDDQLAAVAVVSTRGWPGPDDGDAAPGLAAPGLAARGDAVARVVAPSRARLVDAWLDASWRGRRDAGRWQLDAGATLERLRPPGERIATERAAARAAIVRRERAGGDHTLRAGGEVGAGAGPAGAGHDHALWLSDAWQPTASLTVVAGVHAEARVDGPARRAVVAPHATLAWASWDGRRPRLFVDASRRAALDAVAPADAAPWTEYVAGGDLEVAETLALGAAWRARGGAGAARQAALGWLGWRPTGWLAGTEARAAWELDLGAGGAHALTAQLVHRRDHGALAGWQLAAALATDAAGARAGAALGWHGRRDVDGGRPALGVDVEAYAGASPADGADRDVAGADRADRAVRVVLTLGEP